MEQYFPVRWTNPLLPEVPPFDEKLIASGVRQSKIFKSLSHAISSKFCAKVRNQTEDSLTFVCFNCFGLLEDSEVEINDVLGEGDNIFFIVRI